MATSNNPRKFSEKIALHNQKQAEETAAFEEVMKDLSLTRAARVRGLSAPTLRGREEREGARVRRVHGAGGARRGRGACGGAGLGTDRGYRCPYAPDIVGGKGAPTSPVPERVQVPPHLCYLEVGIGVTTSLLSGEDSGLYIITTWRE